MHAEANSRAKVGEVERIEAALAALLSAMIEARDVPDLPKGHDPVPVFTSGATAFRWRDPASFPTRVESAFDELLRRPVYSALRQAVRTLGERAADLVPHLGAMQDLCERAAERDPKHSELRIAIVDAAWDGIANDKLEWAA